MATRSVVRLSLPVALFVALLGGGTRSQERPPAVFSPTDRESLDRGTCRGERQASVFSRAFEAPVETGEPISFRQEPPLLSASHPGPVGLSEVLIAGDVESIQFERYDPTGDDPVETWQRIGTTMVGTRLASVFRAEWPPEVLAAVIGPTAVGVDYPLLYWGSILVPGDPPSRRGVYLRVATGGLPTSVVQRIDDTAQFASHVVNLVIPDFGQRRAEGGIQELDFRKAAKAFYQHFADEYDVLAFVAEPGQFMTDGQLVLNAWHRNVRNSVHGINAQLLDDSANFGSQGVLQGIEMYRDAMAVTFRVANHELSHQWGHYFDWERLAGLSRVWPDTAHTPLMWPGQSLIGAELLPKYRVARTDAGTYQLERTPSPIEAGPLELYAMGLLSVADLPPMAVFEDQKQFAEGRTPTTPGAVFQGATRLVSGSEIVSVHGTRSGAVPTVLSRALVVVSRDGLLTQREMDYWNFFAARLEDPNGVAPPSFEGYVAFDRTTRRAVDLRTRIRPRRHDRIEQGFDVDYPPLSATDCRGVVFGAPVPTFRRPGERFTVSGQVVARDRTDFHQVGIRFWPYGGSSATSVMEYGDVDATGRFAVTFEFRDTQVGTYEMDVFLFWPGAPSQYSRCSLTPIRVAPEP